MRLDGGHRRSLNDERVFAGCDLAGERAGVADLSSQGERGLLPARVSVGSLIDAGDNNLLLRNHGDGQERVENTQGKREKTEGRFKSCDCDFSYS